MPVGSIDTCDVCKNRAELFKYPDGRHVCGDCREAMNAGAQRRLEQSPESVSEGMREHLLSGGRGELAHRTVAISEAPDNEERETYLAVIEAKADGSWVAKFIKEVVAKKILKYDWKRVLRNSRWFSVLDLRRMALELDPDFEKEEPEEEVLAVPKEEAETPGELKEKPDAETGT